MNQREAITAALDKAQRFGGTRLVVFRPDWIGRDGGAYYTIKASEKRLWAPGERCLLIVPA